MIGATEKYGVVVADPAWNFRNTNVNGAAEKHYPTMSTRAICEMDVSSIMADDAVLFLWACWPMVPDALKVIEAWGFEFKTGFPWIKLASPPFVDLFGDEHIKILAYGTGFWIRGCTEPLFIASRGDVKPDSGDFVGLLSERFQHSRKPDNIYDLAERYPGPRVELFARRARVGWDQLGNEVGEQVDFNRQVGEVVEPPRGQEAKEAGWYCGENQ